MKHSLRATAMIMLAALLPMTISAEVVDSSPTGFLVRNTVNVAATPKRAYDALVEHVADWWNPEHTFSGVSRNLTLDARPGGCLCEQLPNGGGVQHLTVVFIMPGTMIRFAGAMGPMQSYGVAGSLTYTFVAHGDSTTIEETYSVGGYFKGGLDKIAPIANTVLSEQLGRLRSYIDTGRPTEK